MPLFKNKQEFYEKYRSEIGNLSAKFTGYIVTITQQRIKDYLCQFELNDKPVGLKLLQNIDYYSNERISHLTKQLGGVLKNETNQSFTDVYFCPTDSSSGSSTDVIINKFRNFMGMNDSKYNHKFIHAYDLEKFVLELDIQIENLSEKISSIQNISDADISDIERQDKIADLEQQILILRQQSLEENRKTIVFIDDYVGSGQSFKCFWATIGSYYNIKYRYILAVLVGHEQGITSIKSDIPIEIILPNKPIPLYAKIFHNENTKLTIDEKKTIQKYCDRMKFPPKHKYGFMDTQSMVVIYARSPNNILPILYGGANNWWPLFPRRI